MIWFVKWFRENDNTQVFFSDKVISGVEFSTVHLYLNNIQCDQIILLLLNVSINFEIDFLDRAFYSTVKSYRRPFKRRIKIDPRLLPHPSLRIIRLVFSSGVIIFFVDPPLIPCLVDLVHAFNGVVLKLFEKWLEKLCSDSILLWLLLKLLFKILQ